MAFQHELSWSASRAGTFAACKRRYYYDYYLSWLGWDRRAEPERKQAYLLKKMTRMPMLAGDLVHQAIERWLRGQAGGRAMSLEALVRFASDGLREGYKTSRSGQWKSRPSKLVHLAEHHYDEACVDEKDGSATEYGKRYLERMETALRNFLRSPELDEARRAPADSILACEDMSTFDLFETKVYAVPDFAYRDEQNRIHVYDWKTGKPRERDRFQLAVYVEYAVAQWDADPDQVVCYDAYLGTDDLVHVESDETTRAETLERMRTSMEEMQALHFNADRTMGDLETFPVIPEDAPEARECTRCNYRELCDRVALSP